MLERFISGLREANVPEFSDLEKYTVQCIQIFASLSDFLRNSERFPNRDINKVVNEMRFLMARKRIPLITGNRDIDELVFGLKGKEGKMTPVIFVPEDYPGKVRRDPFWQFGMIAIKASLIKDFFSGMIPNPPETSKEVTLLAEAFCAETLLTLKRMIEEEGIRWQPSKAEREVFKAYPKGLKSLPSGLYQPDLIIFSPDPPTA